MVSSRNGGGFRELPRSPDSEQLDFQSHGPKPGTRMPNAKTGILRAFPREKPTVPLFYDLPERLRRGCGKVKFSS